MSIKKKIIVGLGIFIALLVIIKVIFVIYDWYQARQWYAKTDAFTAALQKPFKEDTYGGKTPEETMRLFFEDIKQGDLKKASTLYDANHQSQAYERLQNLQNGQRLEQWINNLHSLEKNKIQAGKKLVSYSYKYFDSDTHQYLWAPLTFYLNPFTNVWKIVY